MSFGKMYYLIESFVSNYTVGRLTDTFNLTDNDMKKLTKQLKKQNRNGWKKQKKKSNYMTVN